MPEPFKIPGSNAGGETISPQFQKIYDQRNNIIIKISDKKSGIKKGPPDRGPDEKSMTNTTTTLIRQT